MTTPENVPHTDVRSALDDISSVLRDEVVQDLARTENVRIERILSRGHVSPESGWYDQDEHEWVMVLQGAGRLQFANGDDVQLQPGDYITIPAHCRHRVSWTHPEQVTIWLAVFYR
ncbi:cupin domain-containing protein [Thiorhodovibrio frisius]|nr:cupin domain-containing protein [Thiorhodovibrio frisius]